jgi:hypothetical protein
MNKRISLFLAMIVVGALAYGAPVPNPVASDYKAQMEAALGGKILAVQKTTRYPASSLTQVLNFTVDRGGGRTEIVPVQVVFVKVGDSYVVNSMSVASTSSAMAIQRQTTLPVPEPGAGGGGGTGGTTTTQLSKAEQCKNECTSKLSGTGPLDIAKYAACFFCCMYGLPFMPK